jgi:hypothetical protein
VDPLAHLLIAAGACLAFLAVALLTWVALRVEALHKRVQPPPPVRERCDRLHASDLAQRWFEGQAPVGEDPLPAEDLPGFRAGRVVDEEEVNPRISPPRRKP